MGQEQGIAVLSKAITACTEAIEEQKGKLVVKEAARAVSVTLTFNFNVDFAICLTFSGL
jgi:hypothetical protein